MFQILQQLIHLMSRNRRLMQIHEPLGEILRIVKIVIIPNPPHTTREIIRIRVQKRQNVIFANEGTSAGARATTSSRWIREQFFEILVDKFRLSLHRGDDYLRGPSGSREARHHRRLDVEDEVTPIRGSEMRGAEFEARGVVDEEVAASILQQGGPLAHFEFRRELILFWRRLVVVRRGCRGGCGEVICRSSRGR